MQTITTIGLDFAKSVFQVHGVDAAGEIVVRRKLRRPQCWRSSRAAAVSGGDGGLRLVAPLGAGADRARPRREADAAAVREALCQAAEERCG